MPHIITHKLNRGTAAQGREEIRALEDVGRTPGGIQYRTQTGAQAELSLPTATDMYIGHDGTRPTWVSATQVATATQAATATQPVLSYLYTVTASATAINLSWASATQYSSIETIWRSIRAATQCVLAMRFSTDGTTVNTATNANAWGLAIAESAGAGGLNLTAYGSTATNAASQALLTATGAGMLLATDGMFRGYMNFFIDSRGGAETPGMQSEFTYSMAAGNVRFGRVSGHANYWPANDILGVRIYTQFGAGSFIDGLVDVYGRV